jgi:uncharacterized protein YprB with RNaseH-like and TPR domain
VLRSTFLVVRGIGPWTESQLWRSGIGSWAEFRGRRGVDGVSDSRKARWDLELELAERAVMERSADWFGSRLPYPEHWRLYPEFRPETAFLDIETTSLSPYQGIVTVVTVHGGGATRTFVAGENLEELPAYLRRFRVLASFNGIYFDVPFLQAAFPQWVPPAAHIDLRFVLRRLGYSGGLKRIEQQLGLGDRSGVEGIHGPDAVRLWHEYRRGKREALDLLVEYNRADTVNLEPLLEFATSELARRLRPGGPLRPLEAYGALTSPGPRPPGSAGQAPPAATGPSFGSAPPTSD